MCSFFAETITSLQPEIAVRVVPGPPPNNLLTFTFLTCISEPSTLTTSDFVSRWTIPSGQTFTFNQRNPPSFERFRVSQGDVPAGEGRRQATLLFIQNLMYQDAGNYTCEARDSSAPAQSPWFLATVELQLEGKDSHLDGKIQSMYLNESTVTYFTVNLTAIESSVTAYSNDSEVELQCEMTQYIRADEDLQWFNGSMMITSGTNRHTVSYHNGTAGAAQNGGSVPIPGRVSVLTISNPQQSDAGTYSCRILGTEQSADIQLNVMPTQQNTLPPTISPTATPTEQSADIQLNVMPTQQNTLPPTISPAATPTGLWTAVTHSTTTLPSGIAAVLIVVGFIILATITVTTIIIIVLLVRRKMFKMTANEAYGKNVHHSETTTPSNTEPTDYVNESLGPNQPTSEDYTYVLPEPYMQRNPAYQLTSELH